MASTVVGLFDSFPEAQDAVRDLASSGIPREDIGLTASDTGDQARAGEEQAGHSHVGTGAATGAGIGAVLGGIGGLLVGLGLLTIPGLGPIVAAGPIAAALAGAGVGAATGGIIGALTGLGIPEEHAHAYAEGVRRGGALVTVTADDATADRVADILNRHGAVDVDERAAEWRREGWTGFREEAAPRAAADRGTAAGIPAGQAGEIRMPVAEEELRVGKREVQRGGVRIYQRVEEQPVREEVALREEHVTVDRRPVDRPVTTGDQEAFQERTYEVREVAEEPVVSKQAHVAEEVVIRRDVDERRETVSDTVRRTDVDVQPVGPAGRSDADAEWRSDFDTRYASRGDQYERYAPAYQYGSELASDPRYSGREWSYIEASARGDWESRGHGRWDDFKDAIRHGWDRVRGRERRDRAA